MHVNLPGRVLFEDHLRRVQWVESCVILAVHSLGVSVNVEHWINKTVVIQIKEPYHLLDEVSGGH
jgi:hypothetical protein